MSIRVVVYCDEAIMGAGLSALLRQHDLDVRVETSLDRTRRAAVESRPDALIVVAPVLTVDDRCELAELSRLSRVILLTTAEYAHRAFEALRHGVHAVLSVESSAKALIHVITTVVQGNSLVAPLAARTSLGKPLEKKPTLPIRKIAERLTPREREILLLLTRGISNAEIAQKLSVSKATVRSHVHNVLHKLGTATRAQAVAVAYQTGLVDAIASPVRQADTTDAD